MIKGLLISIAFFALSFVQAQERPRPALAKPYLYAPLVLDGKVAAQLWLFPREDRRQFAVEALPVMESLRPQLMDEGIKNLERRVRPEGVLYLTDLESVGIKPQFREAELELHLEVPLRYRKSQELDLNFVSVGDQKFIRPSEHSGYLNLRAQQTYQYGENVPNEKLPLSGTLELVENINGFVFESLGDYQEGAEYAWRRQDTRLRFDSEEKMIRTTVGDLTLGARGFQSAPLMAGVSVVREFSIQPYKTIRPLNNTEIVIKRPSLLEVYVNGFLYSQLRLAPGIFNIRDFPLATGQNSVKVKIRDDLGQEEFYDFSVLFENTLLGKDVHEFSYSAGLPWTISGADRAYDRSGVFSNFFHRWGVSDEMTLGVNFQNYFEQSLWGMEISGISRWGYLSFDGAHGSASARRSGFAERVRYRSLDRMFGRDVPVVVALEVENRETGFTPVTALGLIGTNYTRRYDGQVNFRASSAWVFGVGSGTLEYPGALNRTNYRSNLIIPLGLQARLELSLSKETGAVEEERGLISFFWSERQGRYSASAYYDSLQSSSTASVTKNNLYRYDDSRWTASLQNREGQNSGSLSAEYLAQPFSARLEQFSQFADGNQRHSTGLGLNTALTWVGSRTAFSQPITDSFVLVRGANLPAGQELLINPTGEKAEAQLGPRQVTVLRDQASYYKYFVNMDSTTLPLGYLMEREYFPVQPTYRSGIAIDLNFKSRVMVKGRLVDAVNNPVALIAGDILNSQGQLVDNTFFTNKTGGFLIEGLEPGRYSIVTGKPGARAVSFEVAPSENNLLNLGELILEVEE